MDQASKNVLLEIFSILGFSDEEKERTLLDFQKKLAMELLHLIQHELPVEYQEFITKEGAKITDPNHPMVAKIQKEVKKLHSIEEYYTMSRGILKGLLPQYIRYLTNGLSSEKVELLESCLKKFS